MDPMLLLLELDEIENELLDLIELVGDEDRHAEIMARWDLAQKRVKKFRRNVQSLVDNSSNGN
jgi:hypothetical protein